MRWLRADEERRAFRFRMTRSDRRRWEAARSLAEVAALTAEWLEGGIESQPGYQPGYGPATETTGLIGVLAATNRAGLLTHGSQPGEEVTDDDGRVWRQRAAVDLHVPTGLADRFVDQFRGTGLTVIRESRTLGRDVIGPVDMLRHDGALGCTTCDGVPVTAFGGREPDRSVRFRYAGLDRDAVDEICAADQITIADTDWGRNDRLWPLLEAAVAQRPRPSKDRPPVNIADTDNWKIKHLLDKTSLKWVLAVALERHDQVPELDPPLRSGDRRRAAIELHDTHWALLRDLIDKYDLDLVLRSVLLREGKLDAIEYDTVDDMLARATAELELIDLPENPVPPVTITEVANESREQVGVELTLSMGQEQTRALAEVFPPWASDNGWATRYANLTGEDAVQLHDWLDTVEYAVHLLRSGSLKLDGSRDPATLQALDSCIMDLVIGLQPRFEGIIAALYLARNAAGGSWVELANLTGTASTTLQSRVKKIQANPQWVDWATGAQSPDTERHPVVLHTPHTQEPSAPDGRRPVQAAAGTTTEEGQR